MGFDNECILNIQSLAGEYFCPVCRTLVYPNEALQAQCTHLYCKPCLTYVVSSTQACPYDGYLVTEAASKPLVESNKVLAETIGKIAVHCLYHRSGCTWQGPLSECTTHCSGCAFGNSPVVCNRCGVQIVHRQVQEHAQTCNVNLQGAPAQPQQGIESVQVSATSGAAVPLDQSKGVGQQGVQATAQPSQNVVGAHPGQNLNQQAITNAQSQPAPTTTTVPTPEQWYQQQYQQYYQQYPGYDPYQQAYQPYYPYQPQANPQFQQQPLHVQGPQSQPQPQLQLQHQAQTPAQLPNQPQAQPQVPAQTHTQSQVQQQIPSQGQPQANPFSQAMVLPQNQSQAQVNPQQQIHPAAQAHAQVQSQTHQLPHGVLPSQPYPQTQAHQVQNHPQQHLPVPQYQQHPQMHHAQPPSQVPPQSQSHVQVHAQPPFQPHSQLQPPNQHPAVQSVAGQAPYPQSQTQQQMQQGPLQQQLMQVQPSSGSLPPGQVQGQLTQPPPHVRPLQPYSSLPNNQPAMLPSQGQTPNIPPAQYIQPHNQQPSLPVTQRPVVHPVQQSGPQQYVQPQQAFTGQLPGPAQGQFHQPGHFAPQQAQLRPQGPHSTQQNPVGYVQQQQSVAYGVQPQQVQNYAGRPAFPNHIVQPQQFPQPSGSMGVAPQPRPSQSGPGQQSANQPYVNVKNQMQPGVLTNGASVERKSDQISDRSVDQKESKSPTQEVSEKEVNGLAADSIEKKSETGLKSMNDEYKVGGEREENYRQEEAPSKDQVSEVYQMKNVSGDPAIAQKVKEEGKDSTLEHSPSQPLGQHKLMDERDATGDSFRQGDKSAANATAMASAEVYQDRNSSQPQIAPQGRIGDVSGGFQTKGFEQSSHSVPSDQGRPQPPSMPLGSSGHLQQRPPFPPLSQPVPPSGPPSSSQLPGHPPAVPRHQGHGSLPHPGQALNPQEYFQQPMLNQSSSFHPDHGFGGPAALYGRGPNHSGNHPRSFEQGHIPGWHAGHSRMSQGEPMGPPMGAIPPGSYEQQDGLMGRGLPRAPEGLSGQHRPIPPIEAEAFANHRPPHFDGRLPESHVAGTTERGPAGQPFNVEPNPMRTNGAPRVDSSPAFASRDDKFKTSTDERSESLPIGPTRRLDQTEVQEGVKQFPRPHVGTEATPKFGNNFISSRPMDKSGYGMDGPSRPFDKGPHGFNFDAGQKLDASGVLLPHHAAGMHDDNRGRPDPNRTNKAFFSPGSAFGLHHMDREPPRSPGRQYLNNQPHPFRSLSGHRIDDIDGNEATFGEGYKSFDHISESAGHSRHESRFPHLPPGNMRRGKLDGPGNYGMGENMRSGDMIGKDIPPGHLRRGEYLGPRNLSGRPHMGETGFDSFPGHGYVGESGVRPGGFPLHQPFGESFGNKPSHPRLGEPGFRSSYFNHGFPNDGRYFGGDSDSYDQLRKRKPSTMGWCRICKVDCETVEGLDMHAQSREHQKMSMDMVISIKQKNSKKQKTSGESGREEGGSNSKVMGFHGRGNKP